MLLDSRMALSSPKRALIAVAALLCLGGAAAAIYLFRMHGPLRGAHPGQPPPILAELPPDAPIIAYVDVAALRKLHDSPLSALFALTDPGLRGDREYSDFVRGTGFDFTRDLDRVSLAAWPSSLGPHVDPVGDSRIIAVADGRFDQEKIKAYALRAGKSVMRGTKILYEVPGNPPASFLFLSATRIAIASGRNADAILMAGSGHGSRDQTMQSRMDRVAGAPIFIVARTDNFPESFYANFKNSPQLEHFVRSVLGLSLAGQPDGDRVNLALDAECKSMKDALEIATLLDGFRLLGSLAVADPKTRLQMTKEQFVFLHALINQTRVTHQDHWVRLSLIITPEMLGASSLAPSPHPATPR
jgi:hypothetical protein